MFSCKKESCSPKTISASVKIDPCRIRLELSQIGELNDINGHLLVDFLNIDKIFNLSTPSYIDEIITYVNKLRNIH